MLWIGVSAAIAGVRVNNSSGDSGSFRIGKRAGPGSSYPGGAYRSLLRFDLSQIPSGATVTDATLEVYAYRYEGSNTFQFYRATEPWEETVTWNTQPSYDSSTILGRCTPKTVPVGIVGFDLLWEA